ncbi:hypothetical protein FSP39_021412 [Pinctada imbricata]|uniref:UBC core domain-containing protein n=1 Tax=Pinctada imbricata TaxID=66713 RepID=A0AA88XJR6_PINIB|nr:hypothetical protein FSP39_021412 [Pinctada imbricata]
MSANQKRLPVIKSGTNGNGYGQYFTEYSLMAEYELLMKQKCPGCYVMPSALTPNKWYGILFIRQGLYQEGVFKFTLTIPDNFPDGDCPTLVFSFPVFHPLVDPQTGELDVKRAFTKWRKNSNHIWQVLRYARLAFYKIDCKQPWNEEAANIYETDAELYKKRVQETISVSKERINDPVKSDDPHELRVSPMDPSVFSETREKMMNAKVNSPSRPPGILPTTTCNTQPFALWPLGNATLANEVIVGGTPPSQSQQAGLNFYSNVELLHPNLSYLPVYLVEANPIDLEIPTAISLPSNSEFYLYLFMWTKKVSANLFHFKTTDPTSSGITEFQIWLSYLHVKGKIKFSDGSEENSFTVIGKDWIVQKVWFRLGIGVDKSNPQMVYKIFLNDDVALQLTSAHINLDLDLPGTLRIGSSFDDSTSNFSGLVTCVHLYGSSNSGTVVDMQKRCNSWNESYSYTTSTEPSSYSDTISTEVVAETTSVDTTTPSSQHTSQDLTEQSSTDDASTTYNPVNTLSGNYSPIGKIATGYFIVLERDTSPQLSPLFNAIVTFSPSACASHCFRDSAICSAFTISKSFESYVCTLSTISSYTEPLAIWPLGNETLANEVKVGGTPASQNQQPGFSISTNNYYLHPFLSYIPAYLDGVNPLDLEVPTTIGTMSNSEFHLYFFVWTKHQDGSLIHYKTTNPIPSGITEYQIWLDSGHIEGNVKFSDDSDDNSFVIGNNVFPQAVWCRIGIGVDKSNPNMIFTIYLDATEALRIYTLHAGFDLDLPGILRIGSNFDDSDSNIIGLVTCVLLYGNANVGSVLDMQNECNSWNGTYYLKAYLYIKKHRRSTHHLCSLKVKKAMKNR